MTREQRTLASVVKKHRVKFDKQKEQQNIPVHTCSLINDVLREFKVDSPKANRLENIRKHNEDLRQLGIDWYELCRDLLDDLEMTLKIQSRNTKVI